jgi:hypothetical protein
MDRTLNLRVFEASPRLPPEDTDNDARGIFLSKPVFDGSRNALRNRFVQAVAGVAKLT